MMHLRIAPGASRGQPEVFLEDDDGRVKSGQLSPTFGSSDLLRLAAHLHDSGYRHISFSISDRTGRAVDDSETDELHEALVRQVGQGNIRAAEDVLREPHRMTVHALKARRPGQLTTTIFATGAVDLAGDDARNFTTALAQWFGGNLTSSNR